MSGAVSPDLGDYAEGKIPVSQVRCVLCRQAPCTCPEFDTQGYWDLIALQDKPHIVRCTCGRYFGGETPEEARREFQAHPWPLCPSN